MAIDFLTERFRYCTRGYIEISWSDPVSGELKYCRHFERNDFAGIAALLNDLGHRQNVNLYFLDATVREKTDRRASDRDFFEAPGLRIDQDKPEHTQASNVTTLVQPNIWVHTGTVPWLRRQAFITTTEPISDAALLVQLNRRLNVMLGGDPTVVNPCRLMRLPGSIAWPFKDGAYISDRVPELVTWHRNPAVNAASYSLAHLAATLPELKIQSQESPDRQSGAPVPCDQYIDELQVEGCENWHNKMTTLVAAWVGRGWTDKEIIAWAPRFNVRKHDGTTYATVETEGMMWVAINTARNKYKVPDPVHPAVDPAVVGRQTFETAPLPPGMLPPTPTYDQPVAGDPDRFELLDLPQTLAIHAVKPEFLVEMVIPRGNLTVFTGMPSAGKSPLVQYLCACMITGAAYNGLPVQEGLRGAYVARESENQTAMNVPNMIAELMGIAEGPTHDSVIANVEKRLLFLTSRRADGRPNPPFFLETETYNLIGTLKREAGARGRWGADPDFTILDTLRAMSTGGVTDDKDMGLVQQAIDLIRVAFPRMAIILIHHSPKTDPEGMTGSNRLFAMSDNVFAVVPIAHGASADDGSHVKNPDFSVASIDGWAHAPLRIRHLRNKVWRTNANTLVTLRVKENRAMMSFEKPGTGVPVIPPAPPFPPLPGAPDTGPPDMVGPFASPFQAITPPASFGNPEELDDMVDDGPSTFLDIAYDTILYALSHYPDGTPIGGILTTLNHLSHHPEVARLLGIGKTEAHMRTYMLRRLDKMLTLGIVRKSGAGPTTVWHSVPYSPT